MKLATYDDGSRDGQLVVVSRDLQTAHYATHIATRLQQVLDDWNFLAPQLQDLALTLDLGKARHAFAFEPARCLAPLPRASQWSEVQACRAVEPASTDADVLPAGRVQHLPADGGTGALAAAVIADASAGIDFAPGWAVLTGDIAQGAVPAQALEGVRLLMLVNAWHAVAPVLKGRQAAQALIGAGQRLPVACSPVAVTPDELGAAWTGGKPALSLGVAVDGRSSARVDLAAEGGLHAGQLLACLTRHRGLRAGSIVSGGVVPGAGLAGRPGGVEEMVPAAAWLVAGSSVRVEALDATGASVFGAIDQELVALADANRPGATPPEAA